MRRGKRLLATVLTVMAAVTVVLILRQVIGPYLEGRFAPRLLAQLGLWAPAVYIGLYTVRPLALVPASALTLLAGVLWGPWVGLAYALAGATGSAVLAFLLSRYLGRSWVEKRLPKRGLMADFDRLTLDQSFRVTMSLRLMPGLPFDLVSYAAGLSHAKLGPFMAATIIGAVPGTLALSLMGGSITKAPPEAALTAGVILLAMALSTWLIWPRPPLRGA